MQEKLRKFLQTLGPGILFASAANGVSHLVQSTRAGALYGFGLLWAVILANLFKYPFFEYGSRYSSATGESIIDGYRRIGKPVLWIYALITLGSMFFVCAAVGAVTAGFMDSLFGMSQYISGWSFFHTAALLFVICLGILLSGQYRALDRLIKVVGSVLLISTLFAVGLAIVKGPAATELPTFTLDVLEPGTAGFAFLIALMGWMPTAVDLSAWNSLWTLERIRESGYKPSLRETLREFDIGYLVSAVLAPCFMLLGAYVIFGTGREMPESSAAFSNSIVSLYTENMGAWSRPFITAAAFSIMFGTIIAIFDGYARSFERVIELMTQDRPARTGSQKQGKRGIYLATVFVLGSGALWIIYQFTNSLKALVDVATSISFIIAPVIAIANFKLVMGLKDHQRPARGMRVLSYAGIAFLGIFSLVYLWWLLVR